MRLKELRKNRKLKQREIADALNCSQAVYSRYESGDREPPFDILVALATYYGVTVDYLLGRDTAPLAHDLGHGETKAAPAPDMRAEAKALLEAMTDDQYQAALQYLKFLKAQGK